MAILKGIKVIVQVNGSDLPEYEDADYHGDHETSVSKWIQATSGANFKITITVPNWFTFTSTGLSFRVSIDGQDISSRLCSQRNPAFVKGRDWHHRFQGSLVVIQGKEHQRKFEFCEVKQGKLGVRFFAVH